MEPGLSRTGSLKAGGVSQYKIAIQDTAIRLESPRPIWLENYANSLAKISRRHSMFAVMFSLSASEVLERPRASGIGEKALSALCFQACCRRCSGPLAL